MKKQFLKTLCVVAISCLSYSSFFFTGSETDISRSGKSFRPISNVLKLQDMSGNTYISDFDVSSSGSFDNVPTFSGCHPEFGLVSQISDSVAYKNENRPTYDSYWNHDQPTDYISLVVNQYNTYSFAKYLDFPIEIYHTRRVAPGSSQSFTIERTESTTTSQSSTVEKGNSAYFDYSESHGYNAGAKVALDEIGLNGSMSSSKKINVGASVYSIVTGTKSKTTTFSTVYTEIFTFDNTANTEYRYFQLNQRQKFKAYFTTNYSRCYTTTSWGSGLFGLDQNWSYAFSHYSGVETRFFLIPIETPYFEMSLYHDNSSGLKEYIGNSSSTVCYL